MSEESPSKNKGIDKKFFKLSTTSSLPLVLNDVCVLRSEPGMDILPRSSALGQYHNPHLPHNIHNFHHHTDQTKSLQELQNEVGALLEFRDLVIETFPDLKHKMASSGANSTITGIPTLSSIVSRREWEPGIRVRRKLNNNQKEGSNSSSSGAGEIIQSTSLLTRSRSNSHSGKKELKSGEGGGGGGNVSVVQDSGFSSSSKDAHSATSNNNNNSSTLSGRLGSTENSASENELWNLLDVIQRRTARVSDEIGHYHEFEKKKRSEKSGASVVLHDPQEPITFHTNLYNLSKESVRLLQKERDNMMDKMGDLEAECHYRRIKESNFQQQLDEMQQAKSTTSRNHIIPILPELPTRKLETNPSKHLLKSTEILPPSFHGPSTTTSNVKPLKNELGHLDFLFSPSPNSKTNKVRQPDSKKIAAILLETNVIELQRHLLTITVHNQVLQQRLENSTRSKNYLIKQLDKSKDDIDDLKFQIQERNIELEGTLAQLRVIETKQGNRSESVNAEHLSGLAGSLMQLPNNSLQQQNGNVVQQQTTISTPSMKAMVPLAMDEIFQHSSSTESATHFDDQHDHDIVMTKYPETPKRSKPSKIPLPGSKGYVAKPPTGRNCANPGPPSNSNRSLTKSTGSLFVKYTESSATTSTPKSIKDTSITVANDSSVHSWRNLSFDGKSRSSSIPISKPVLLNVTLSPGKSPSTSSSSTTTGAGISPNTNKYVASSYRRDSLKLTRLQSSASTTTTTLNPMRSASTSNNMAGIGSNNSNSSSNRKSTALPVRRLSHNSNNDISDLPADQNVNTNETNGAKVLRIWNFDQSDKTKDEATEFVIDLKQSTEECNVKINNTELQRNFSYKISNIPVGDL